MSRTSSFCGGVVVREYRGFDEVHGDISLRVFPQGAPLSRHEAASDDDPRKLFDGRMKSKLKMTWCLTKCRDLVS